MAGKSLLAKIIQKFGDQDFDYLIFVWDETRFEEEIFKPCHFIYEKGLKWFFAKKYLTPEVCEQYAYIFIWDDDLDVEHFDYKNFIRIMRRNQLEVAQPALSRDSYYTHSLTLKEKGIGRYVDFVEIMAQVFERDAWSAYWKMMEQSGNFWGYGYDDMARALCCYKRMGIVDCESIRHTRPVRDNSNVYSEGRQFMERFDYKMRAQRLAYARLLDH